MRDAGETTAKGANGADEMRTEKMMRAQNKKEKEPKVSSRRVTTDDEDARAFAVTCGERLGRQRMQGMTCLL